jgi:putative protease
VQVLVSTAAQLDAAAASKADDIFIDITDISIESINDMCDTLLEADKRIFLALPRILRKDGVEKLSKFEGVLRNPAVTGYLLRNLDAYLMIADIAARDGKEIIFDYNLYVFNKEAKEFYGFGASGLTAPIELSGEEWKELGVSELTLPVYGRLPLMVTAHCQNRIAGRCLKNATDGRDRAPMILKDRMQKEMPVLSHCAYCFTTIHNSDTYTLAGMLEEVRKMEPKAVRLDLTVESGKETADALKAFEDEWFEERLPGKEFLYRKTCGAYRRGTE